MFLDQPYALMPLQIHAGTGEHEKLALVGPVLTGVEQILKKLKLAGDLPAVDSASVDHFPQGIALAIQQFVEPSLLLIAHVLVAAQAAAGEGTGILAGNADDGAEAVMLDLVNPAGARGRLGRENRDLRRNERGNLERLVRHAGSNNGRRGWSRVRSMLL
jgi:hypothetical protein